MTAGLDPGLSFATLVTGGANQLALAAARASAESSRPPFNPLVIQGAPGLGKSHLLHAIGHRKLEVDPRAVVRLTSWEALLEGWRSAAAAGRTSEFLAPYREAALLLVDDADRLGDAGAGREPLLAMLEERLIQRRTTVLASRRPATELLPADDPAHRLLSAGLVVDLDLPDSAMRWEILHRLTEQTGTSLSDAVLEEIAGLPFGSVVELVAAGRRLLAFQAVSPTPLDPSQARVLVTGIVDQPRPDAGEVAGPAAPPRPPAARRAAAVEDLDEFGSFLSDVVASVSAQVDEWRAQIADVMVRWESEGFRTARLRALLDQEVPAQPDQVLQRFEADVRQLKELEAAVREAAPDLELPDLLRDPDRVAAAVEFLEQVRTRDLAASLPASQFRFEDLVEGTPYRLAVEAARSLSAGPEQASSPLLIVGESGVGKTHLLHAIGNALVDQGRRGVVCESAHTFQTRLVEAEQGSQLSAWRRRYRWVTALLLDDIHLLSGQPVVQEELASLFEQLDSVKAPVVLASAVAPAELTGLSPQLLAWLGSGVMVELPRPDRDTRLQLVQRLLGATEAADEAGLADYLASRPADSVRAVQNLVQRVLRAAAQEGARPTLALARQVLEAPGRVAPARARPRQTGVLGPSLAGARLREKLVETWPMVADRLVEEFR